MSRGNGSSIIPVAVFFAILLILLPVSADNVTVSTTNVTTEVTTVLPTETTAVPTETTVASTTTTAAATQTTTAPAQTTVTTTQAVATTPAAVTTQPAAPVTTLPPATPAAAATGSVSVYSSPTGASILIDGVYTGTTPKTIEGVPAGNHILRLTLSGYSDYEGSIYVVPGQTAQGYGTLQPINPAVSAAPTASGIVTVLVPVITPTAEPTQDPGLLGNSSVIVAIIGVITALIAAGASIFTHVKPPKKE